MKPIPLVRKAALAPAVSYLAGEGVSVSRYLGEAGLSAPSPENLETLMPLHQLCGFLSSVARSEGINDLGFRIGGHMGTESLGAYGRLIAQSLTIHESVQLSRAFVASYNSGLQIWLEHHGDQVRYCQKYVENLPRDRITEVVHLGLANALANSGYGDGAGWQLNRIELASDPIDLSTYFPELADVPVSFRQPFTSLWVDTSVMSSPIRRDTSDDPRADATARNSFLESGPASDPIGQLEQAIESVLNQPGVNLQLTAAITGTSARTLQRRLAEHGASFSHLLQRIRFRTAQHLLQDPEMPLKEIAKRLGYTDLANFIRAFKRWTGVGPSKFRRLHYGHGRE